MSVYVRRVTYGCTHRRTFGRKCKYIRTGWPTGVCTPEDGNFFLHIHTYINRRGTQTIRYVHTLVVAKWRPLLVWWLSEGFWQHHLFWANWQTLNLSFKFDWADQNWTDGNVSLIHEQWHIHKKRKRERERERESWVPSSSNALTSNISGASSKRSSLVVVVISILWMVSTNTSHLNWVPVATNSVRDRRGGEERRGRGGKIDTEEKQFHTYINACIKTLNTYTHNTTHRRTHR